MIDVPIDCRLISETKYYNFYNAQTNICDYLIFKTRILSGLVF